MNYSEFKYSFFIINRAFKCLGLCLILLFSSLPVFGQQTEGEAPEVDSMSVQAVSQNDSVYMKPAFVFVSENTLLVNLKESNEVQIVYQKEQIKASPVETRHKAEKRAKPNSDVIKENTVVRTKPIKRKIVLIPLETDQSFSCGSLNNSACLTVSKVKSAIAIVSEINSSVEVFNQKQNLPFYCRAYDIKFFNDLAKRGPPLI